MYSIRRLISNIKIGVLEQVAYIIYVCHLDVLHFISKILLLLSNGRSWIYSISLLASQYSFDSSLEV